MRFSAARIVAPLLVTTGLPRFASMAGAASAARMSVHESTTACASSRDAGLQT